MVAALVCLVMASRLHTGGSGEGSGVREQHRLLRGRGNRLGVLVLKNGSKEVLPVSYIVKGLKIFAN